MWQVSIPSLPARIATDRPLGPYFPPPRLTGDVYCDFLRKVLPELLQGMDPQIGIRLWFVHDSDLPHFLIAVREFLNKMLPGEVEKQRGLLVHLISVHCIFISGDISGPLFALQKSVEFKTCNNEYRTDLIWFVRHLEFFSASRVDTAQTWNVLHRSSRLTLTAYNIFSLVLWCNFTFSRFGRKFFAHSVYQLH
jgi:hypothetical protein